MSTIENPIEAALYEIKHMEIPKGGLLHVKIGAPASDMGGNVPWIPTEDDLEEFQSRVSELLPDGTVCIVTHRWTEIVPIPPGEVEDTLMSNIRPKTQENPPA